MMNGMSQLNDEYQADLAARRQVCIVVSVVSFLTPRGFRRLDRC